MGLIDEHASLGGICNTSYALNLVQTKEARANYIVSQNNDVKAYFKNASFAYVYPIYLNDILIDGYKYEAIKNCYNNEYTQAVVKRVCDISSIGDIYMTSYIDLSNY